MRISESERRVLPMNKIFSELISIWCEKTGKKQSSLSKILNINPQSISQWKTGTNARRPPWGIIMVILSSTGKSLIINKSGYQIVDDEEVVK